MPCITVVSVVFVIYMTYESLPISLASSEQLRHQASLLTQDKRTIYSGFHADHLWRTRSFFMAPHSSTLAWKTPWTEKPGRLQSMGSLSQTWLSNFTFTFRFHALEDGNPLQCSRLENPRDRGAWWAVVYGVAQSRTRLKRLSSSSSRGHISCRPDTFLGGIRWLLDG